MIPSHPAFTFTALQDELLQAALRRDGRTALRWTALHACRSREEVTQRKARRLLPLIEDGLRCESAPADLPGRSTVCEAYASAEREHDARVAWVAPLIDMLQQVGVEIIVLKGLSLALSYYAAPALRPMVDVDVLIRPRDIDTTIATLEAAGWTPRAPLPQNHVRRRREVDLRGPAGEKLDLHWHLHPAFITPGDGSTDDEQFFARAVPLTVGTTTSSMLDPTDLFLHVLVHGATTGWPSHPLWVADAVTMIERGPELDGDRFVSLARASGVALPVVRALASLAGQFGRAPRVRGRTESLSELARIAHAPLIRQRRIYAQIASGWATPRWLQWVLGPFASTYHYWAIQTVTWTRRRAAQEFPGWLADTWYLDSPAALPRAAWEKLRHPLHAELGDGTREVTSPRR